ncbi:MAG: hypothetical protein IPO78_10220 [Saprospiraceae bacterium]|nr:hypothetical protein [Saprospiraceae bacterium]
MYSTNTWTSSKSGSKFSRIIRSGICHFQTLLIILLISCVSFTCLYAGCTCNGTGTTIGASNTTTNIDSYVSSPRTSGCFIIKGTVQINVDFEFRTCQLQMEEGAELKVLSGKTLKLINIRSGGGIHGCDYMWRGINVGSNATLIMTGTYISDAQYAIKASGTAKIMAHNNQFTYNYVGIYTPSTGGNVQNVTFNVYDNLFDSPSDGALNLPEYTNYGGMSPDANGYSYAGFLINNASVVIGSATNPLDPPNVIHHMRAGVVGKKSNLQCYNMVISDLIPYYTNQGYASAAGDGIGIYARDNSVLTAVNNTIDNTPYSGISGRQSLLQKITSNEISNIEVGIYNLNGTNSAQIYLNDIEYFKNWGIVELLPSNLVNTMISYNDVSTFGTSPNSGFTTNGVLISGVGGNPYVVYNNINLHSNAIGINVVSSNRVNSAYNIINFDDDSDDGDYGDGIAYTSSRNGTVFSNEVYAEDGFDYINGFNIYDANNGKYCCNLTSGTNNGFLFAGDCKRLGGFGHSEISALTMGLWVGSSTIMGKQINGEISTQVHRGNNWNGSYPGASSSAGAAVNLGTIKEIRSSKFYVETCSSPLWPPTIYPSQSCNNLFNNWFLYSTDGSAEDCGEDSFCEFSIMGPNLIVEYKPIDSGDVFISRGLFTDGEYGFALDYESRRSLFERMWIDTASHNKDSYVDSFFTATSSSTIADFNEIHFAIDTLLSYTDNEQDSIETILGQMRLLQDSIRVLDSLFYLAANATDTSNILALRDTAFGQLDTLTDHYHGVTSIYKTRVLSNKSAIIYQNSIISPINIIDTNEQIVNDLYLAQLMEDDFLFDVTQGAQLLGVAEQCPRLGGAIVFKARELYRLVDNVIFNDSICFPEFASVRSNNKVKLSSGYVFAPVPATNYLAIHIGKISKLDNITLELKDLLGKTIYSSIVNEPVSNSIINIQIPDNLQGVFIGIIRNDEKIVHKQKLIFLGQN